MSCTGTAACCCRDVLYDLCRRWYTLHEMSVVDYLDKAAGKNSLLATNPRIYKSSICPPPTFVLTFSSIHEALTCSARIDLARAGRYMF